MRDFLFVMLFFHLCKQGFHSLLELLRGQLSGLDVKGYGLFVGFLLQLVSSFRVLSVSYTHLKSLFPASRFAARPTSGTTCSRPRKKWSGGRRRCPHRQGSYSSRPHSCSTPGGSGRLPVSSVSVSCGKGNHPACTLWAAVVYMGSLSCVPSIFPLPFSPKRLPASSSQAAYRSFHRKRQTSLAPLLLLSPQSHATLRGPRQWRRVPALARSPQLRDNLSRSDLWTKCPEAGSLQCFPSRGIPFRTVILFSRCCPSMNYPKSTPK